ncbi:MAG: energy transducer TonB family protein [Planctomycetota bacterium]
MARKIVQRLLTAVLAVALTLAFFLVLPVIQTISEAIQQDRFVVVTPEVPAPETPPDVPDPPEPEEEEPEDQPPPQMDQPSDQQLADLNQLGDLLSGTGDSVGFGQSFAAPQIDTQQFAAAGMDSMVNMTELDQKPRPISQASPRTPSQMRGRGGKVHVLFDVNPQGRVENAIVERSTHPLLDAPALEAVRKWTFEPGKRAGQPARFRMRVPIVFPKR